MSKRHKAPETLLEAVAYFSDEETAESFVADLRWPQATEKDCPKCGAVGDHYRITTRKVWKCRDCRKTFSTKLGTIFEDSALPFSKWLPALWMIANCKNGISSHELARALGVTQKSAWFMLHRIRLAMQTGTFKKFGGTVEVDETFVGGKARNMHISKRNRIGIRRGTAGKTAVMGILERCEHGPSRVVAKVVKHMKGKEMTEELRQHVEEGATIYSDADGKFFYLSESFIHDFVNHSIEYVRGQVHSNGIENFWSCFKRTIKGTYINIAPFHTGRYIDEQVRRFNERGKTDKGRFVSVLAAIFGKRLTYSDLIGDRRPA